MVEGVPVTNLLQERQTQTTTFSLPFSSQEPGRGFFTSGTEEGDEVEGQPVYRRSSTRRDVRGTRTETDGRTDTSTDHISGSVKGRMVVIDSSSFRYASLANTTFVENTGSPTT